jgi:hypothetical protein
MRKLVVFTVTTLIVAIPAAVQAGSLGRPCTSASQDKWLSTQELQAKVEAQGFKVQKAKMKNACGEFYTFDKAGSRVELFVDPTTGDIVGRM